MFYKRETLIDLFGYHHGGHFFMLKTPITDITYVMDLVDDGELSPSEIDGLIRKTSGYRRRR